MMDNNLVRLIARYTNANFELPAEIKGYSKEDVLAKSGEMIKKNAIERKNVIAQGISGLPNVKLPAERRTVYYVNKQVMTEVYGMEFPY